MLSTLVKREKEPLMTTCPPTNNTPAHNLITLSLLAVALVAVWGMVILGGSAWLGFLASASMAAGWWVLFRRVRQSRSRTTALEHTIQQIAELVGETQPEFDPQAIADLLSDRLRTLDETIRSWQALFDAIDEPVLALDAEGLIVAANRASSALLLPGASGGVLGELLDQVLPDEPALAAVRAAQQGGATCAQARVLTSAGPRIVEIAAEPIAGQPLGRTTPPRVVLTLRDVTEQAAAMQLKTDFVANASHELRTPVASIKAAAETLHEVGSEDAAMRERLITMIASNAERLEELSRDLLDLSSLESPETACVIERVDLHAIIQDLRSLFAEPCAQRQIRLEFDLDARLATLWTDARLVRLVLRNLLDNAVKFADTETVVRVRGTVLPATRAAPEPPRLDAKLEVIDRGIGIPIAQQQRIFERFFQADEARTGSPARRGTGLGLAIVKHALRTLGGTIRVHSVWQQGTTMTVDLPACVENTLQ